MNLLHLPSSGFFLVLDVIYEKYFSKKVFFVRGLSNSTVNVIYKKFIFKILPLCLTLLNFFIKNFLFYVTYIFNIPLTHEIFILRDSNQNLFKITVDFVAKVNSTFLSASTYYRHMFWIDESEIDISLRYNEMNL